MIRDLVWWWEQLNGPQVTGIMRPIFEHLQGQLDEILEYLNNLSIDTANNAHLTTMGKLMGIPRTYIQEYVIDNFWFTYDLSRNIDYGFALLDSEVGTTNSQMYTYTKEDLDKKGYYTEGQEGQTGTIYQVPDEFYRPILQGVVASGAEIGSLVCMDYILYYLQQRDHQGAEAHYTFKWSTDEMGASSWAPGDITINLGNRNDWNMVTLILAVIQSFSESVFAPEPRWWTEFDLDE